MSQGRVGNNISDVIEDFNSNQQTSLIAQLVKNLLVMQETWVQSVAWKKPYATKQLSLYATTIEPAL